MHTLFKAMFKFRTYYNIFIYIYIYIYIQISPPSQDVTQRQFLSWIKQFEIQFSFS